MTRACLLDTHVWFWLMTGDAALGRASRERIERASIDGAVLVAAISAWEIGMLEAKGRLLLSPSCEKWVETALSQPGVALVPLTPAIAVASTRLPGAFHGDPADRILVATTRLLEADLITGDRRILAYAKRGHVRAIRARS